MNISSLIELIEVRSKSIYRLIQSTNLPKVNFPCNTLILNKDNKNSNNE